jgi:hypothetical protein
MSTSLPLLASVAAVLVLLASAARAQDTVALQSPMENGTLTVQVQYLAGGGAPPAREPGQTRPGSSRWRESPAAGVAVQAMLADTAAPTRVASATTDQAGQAVFTLAAGSYLIVVPRAPSAFPGLWQAVISRELPDGTLVSRMANVDLAPGTSTNVTISLVAPLP